MLFYLILVFSYLSIPEKLAGRYTRLLLSYNPTIGVVHDEITNFLGAVKIKKFDSSVLKIHREGDDFIFKVKDKYVCVVSSKIRTCKEPSLFIFEELSFGYRVIYKYKCLTAGSILSVQECNNANKQQTFVFDLRRSLYCKESARAYEDVIEAPMTKAEVKKIVEAGLKDKKIEDPSAKEMLKKIFDGRERGWSWGWPNWSWPSFDWC